MATSALSERLAVLLQYLLPKQALTVLAGRIASARGGTWTTALIRRFVQHYHVNMDEAANPDIASYASFNDFFTRALTPGVRPLAQDETALSRSLRARPEVVLQPTDCLGCLASIKHQRVQVELDRVDR